MDFRLKVPVCLAQNNLNYPGRYMGREEVKTISALNGTMASADLPSRHSLFMPNPSIEEASRGIWVIGGGYAIWNCVVIDAV